MISIIWIKVPIFQVPGNWKIPENAHAKRVSELLEAYKVVAAREKVEKERKKYSTPKRRSFHPSTSSIMGSGSSSSLSLLSGVNTTPDKFSKVKQALQYDSIYLFWLI